VKISTVSIKEPEVLQVENAFTIQPSCEKSNGAINAEVTGGNGFYKYEWLRGGNTYLQDTMLLPDTIFDLGDTLAFGLYKLRVIDKYNCSVERSFQLDEYFNPKISEISTEDVRCYGESNGSVKVLSTSGTNPLLKSYIEALNFSYSDTIVDIDNSFVNLKKGKYGLYAVDTLNCRSDTLYPIAINQPDTSIYFVLDTVSPVIGKGTPSGIISGTVYGGNEGLKNVLLTNSLDVDINSSQQRAEFPFYLDSLYAGKYVVAVTDGKGCGYTSDSIRVIEPEQPLNFSVIDKKNALCKSQTGSITVQATGGWGDYKYKRNAQNSFHDYRIFENLYAGNYIISVKDKYGATYSDTVVLYEPKDSLRSWITELNSPTCLDNGSIALNVTGGTVPYKVYDEMSNDSLSLPAVQSGMFSNLGVGSYAIKVVDANGCKFNLEAELTSSQLMQLNFANPAYPSTSTSSDGVLRAIVTGGKKPYSYQWRDLFGATFAEISSELKNIPSGHYEVTVTGDNGCSLSSDIYLPNINDLPFEICDKRDESFYQAHNGYCVLTFSNKDWLSFYVVTPSKQKLEFIPDDSSSTFYFKADTVYLRNLEGGDYFVSGFTTANDKVYAEFNIKPYEPFIFSKITVLNVSKIGAHNGEITVDVNGGGGNNLFEWEKIIGSKNEPLTSQDYSESSMVDSATAGDYKVTVADYFGNSISKNIKVEEPADTLKISIDEFKNESCKDSTDAYVVLAANGGWGDYQFRFQDSAFFTNSKHFDDLKVGPHYFYITDKMGVLDSILVNTSEPDYLKADVSVIDSVSCKSLSDGEVGFEIRGGTAPYRFANANYPNLWVEDSVAKRLAVGTYKFMFTDSNNCVGQDTLNVSVFEPDSLLFNNVEVVHTTCEKNNGSVKVQMQGGTLPYRYEWFDIGNNLIGEQNSVDHLAQDGYYTLNVYDKNNCRQKLEQRIKPSTNPVITSVGTTDVVCYGESSGTASILEAQAGIPSAPLSFSWSNGDTGTNSSGYPKGIYFVTVTDTNNCSSVKYFEVVQPDSLRITVLDTKNAKCFGYKDAFIKVEGVGGVSGYKYLWSTGDSAALLGNVGIGDYGLLVTDANNCEVYGVYSVGEPDKLEVDLGDDIKMCPGNTRVIDGQEFTTHRWSTLQGEVSDERYLTVAEADSYFLEVTDSIGCFAYDTVAVTIGNDALQSDFLISSETALGDTLLLVELSNMPLDSMKWDYNNSAFIRVDGSIVQDYILYLKTLDTGIYNIDLYAYSGGCVSLATKQVEIVEESDSTFGNNGLGYNNPLILEFTVNPNPNTGNFRANVKLREIADINLTLFSVASGLMVNERFEYQLQEYSVEYNFAGLNSGVYLLIVKAENERRQIKIIIQ
ncbi:MAG TPA: T9SS type A sorting domain-containing protein, partial [Tenuifilaceae bacterium]|nr:T9SS type A sorting domain-containing protein [Tenuifilaceae bacterium]